MGGFAATQEQLAIVEAFGTGEDLVVTAGAGTGKTSTLRMLAESVSGPGVYLAFNRAVADEAQRSFPRRVQARTAHSFAFQWAKRDRAASPVIHRLGRHSSWSEVSDLLDLQAVKLPTEVGVSTYQPGQVLKWINATVAGFCHSEDEEVGAQHCPEVPGLTADGRSALVELLLSRAQRAWLDMTAPSGVCRVTHDVYLKLWQMSQPVLPGDFVLFDEAQDANPVIANVVARQGQQRVYVGDEAQAIYRFTGAVDAMSSIDIDQRLALTMSFRFGPVIARAANAILDPLKAGIRLSGSPQLESAVADQLAQPRAVLCRTNTTAIAEVLIAQQEGVRTHLLGGTAEAQAFVEGAAELKERRKSSHPALAMFSSWAQVREYVDDGRASEIGTLVNLVDEYGTHVLEAALAQCVDQESHAEAIVSTAHKAKGREWSSVQLADDFALDDAMADLTSADPHKVQGGRDELMLAYVAMTRARDALGVADLHTHFPGFPPVTIAQHPLVEALLSQSSLPSAPVIHVPAGLWAKAVAADVASPEQLRADINVLVTGYLETVTTRSPATTPPGTN